MFRAIYSVRKDDVLLTVGEKRAFSRRKHRIATQAGLAAAKTFRKPYTNAQSESPTNIDDESDGVVLRNRGSENVNENGGDVVREEGYEDTEREE
jgi:hypothetical protein